MRGPFRRTFRRLAKAIGPVLIISAGLVILGPSGPSSAVVGGTAVSSLSNMPFIGYYTATKYSSLDIFHKFPTTESCGATLISPGYAVTAAHCVDDHSFKAADIKLVFGRAKRNGSGGEQRSVTSVITPPGSSPHADLYDLAVLQLNKPITDYALPLMASACPDWTTRSPMFAIGWGQGGKSQDNQKGPENQAQEASLLFDGTLSSLYPDRYFWAVDQADVMQFGDSGDGLFFQRPGGRYEMLGLLHEFLTAGSDWDNTLTRQSVFERTDVGSANWIFLQKYVVGYASCPPTPPST